MKKLFLMLSFLGVVGVQAAQSNDGPKLSLQQLQLRTEIKRDRADIKNITLETGKTVNHSVWQLKANYPLLIAQLKMASESFYLQDKAFARAIIEYGGNGNYKEMLNLAEKVKNTLSQGYYTPYEWLIRKQNAAKNYNFLMELEKDSSGFQLV